MKPQLKRPACNWGLIAAVSIACVACLAPFRFGESLLSFYSDDFYYYVVVARNFAATGVSTFDGATLTNGYHPLWFLVLSLLSKFTSGRLFFFFVSLLVVVGCFATYRISESALHLRPYRGPLVVLGCLWVSCFYIHVARGGMEVILVVPLALALFRYWLTDAFRFTTRQCLMSSLLISALILSRLDTALLIAGMTILYLLLGEEGFIARLRHLALVGICCFPVFAYFIVNKFVFGTFSPVSGAAKQMRSSYVPDLGVLATLFVPHGRGTIIFIEGGLLLVVIACALVLSGATASLRRNQRIVLVSFLLFPLAYYPFLSAINHYPFLPWYDYPIMIGGLAGLFVLQMFAESQGWLAHPITGVLGTAGAILLCVAFLVGLRTPPREKMLYLAAVEIRAFAQSHPGVYAMGDRAGIVSYMSPGRLVQLEGLVEDRKFLENIRQRRNLTDVLREHNVRYYVATNNVTRSRECYLTVEPFQSGPRSPQMHGRFCTQPVAFFPLDEQPSVYIFDVNTEPAH